MFRVNCGNFALENCSKVGPLAGAWKGAKELRVSKLELRSSPQVSKQTLERFYHLGYISGVRSLKHLDMCVLFSCLVDGALLIKSISVKADLPIYTSQE